ncbi:MAG TPA: hypothetical protein GXZ82_08495 [Firmicutes bacterium]|jgi:hypothetical protein|nr:hypothetical protein [Bacillota bacterium]
MWIVGILIVLLGVVYAHSYVVWLWEQGERTACVGVMLLAAFSVIIPICALFIANA